MGREKGLDEGRQIERLAYREREGGREGGKARERARARARERERDGRRGYTQRERGMGTQRPARARTFPLHSSNSL